MNAQPFFLSSRDAKIYGDTYVWTVNDSYLNSFTDFGVTLHKIILPNSVYPINIYNQQVYFKENGGATQNATLSINNYTGAQFATELQTQLTAVGALVYTATYDSQSKLLSISVPGPDTIQFVAGSNDAYDEMGYLVPTVVASTLDGDFPVILSGTNWLNVITNFATRVFDSAITTGTTLQLPVDVPFGNIIFYEATIDDMVECLDGQLSQISVTFTDNKRNPWVLPSSQDFVITLRILPSYAHHQQE